MGGKAWGFANCSDDVGLDTGMAAPDMAGEMQEESRVTDRTELQMGVDPGVDSQKLTHTELFSPKKVGRLCTARAGTGQCPQ